MVIGIERKLVFEPTLREWQGGHYYHIFARRKETAAALHSFDTIRSFGTPAGTLGSTYAGDMTYGRLYRFRLNPETDDRSKFIEWCEPLIAYAVTLGATATCELPNNRGNRVRYKDGFREGGRNMAMEMMADDAYWREHEFQRDYPALAECVNRANERKAK